MRRARLRLRLRLGRLIDRAALMHRDTWGNDMTESLSGLATRVRADRKAGRIVCPVYDARSHKPYRVTYAYGIKSDAYAAGRHTGEDHACPIGSLAVAVMAGTVVTAGEGGPWGPAYGVQVVIRTKDGHDYAHNHLSEALVKVGDKVKVGQVVGHTGMTGNSTGPHDHFEVRPAGGHYGSDVDPVVVKRKVKP